MKVTILDYGLSNLLSVQRAFEHMGAEVLITAASEEVLAADALVLPGVGAFADGMKGLVRLGLAQPLQKKAAAGTPVLGICLGMQMLFDESEEFGLHKGLGLIPGRVVKIPNVTAAGEPQRVPQVGWNSLLPQEGAADFSGSILSGVTPGSEVYFVHSFEARPAVENLLAKTIYGGRAICAAARCKNVTGCQFHPEKSGAVGLSVIAGFLRQAAQHQTGKTTC